MEQLDSDQNVPEEGANERPSLWKRTKRWRKRLLILAAVFLIPIAWLVFDNNVSLTGTTRAEFQEDLDRGLDRSMNWVFQQKVYLCGRSANDALLFMIYDMNHHVPHPEFESMLTIYARTHTSEKSVWRRFVMPQAEVANVDLTLVAARSDYLRWIAHAFSPEDVPLTDEDRESMLAPYRHRRGSATHQLYALMQVRGHGRTSMNVDDLIDTVCERIATEASLDIRVTDLYLQRVAFILAAGRPDLIKRRWVERILDHQQPDGGFLNSWHGWGPGVFTLHFKTERSTAHATIQGVWLLHMLKYRYPEWIERNFPS